MIWRAHFWMGLVGLAAFLGTGLYMDRVHDHLRGQTDVVRMLFRSDHIYLLLSSIVNAMLGLYLTTATVVWRRVVQSLGSIALLAGPPLFLVGFFTEPWRSGLERPWTRPGLYLALSGCVFHLIASSGRRAEARQLGSAEDARSSREF